MPFEPPKRVAENIDRFTGRTWLLPKILDWCERSDEQIFLLVGGPGTGKSMILAWLAGYGPSPQDPTPQEQLTRLRSVVRAAYFCRAASHNISPQAFAESIANQLTKSVKGFADALNAAIDERVQIINVQMIGTLAAGSSATGISIGRLDLGTLGDERSFDRAFIEPLKKLYSSGYSEPMLLLVDALDEAQTYTGVTLPDLLSRLSDLPAGVRILATTRDEPRVLKFFRSVKTFDLIKDADPDIDDVRTYATQRLTKPPTVSDSKRRAFAEHLSKQANGVFLYAAMVLDELLERSIAELPDLAAYRLPEGLSGLYHDFLTRELGKDELKWFELFEPLFGLIAVTQGDGLTAKQLTAIIGKDIRAALRASKQYLSGELPEGPFRPFHQSFSDFLFDREGNTDFYIDARAMHARIAAYYWKQYRENWRECDNYGLVYLPIHAAGAGILDQLVRDELVLVMAAPDTLLPLFVAHSRELPRGIALIYQLAIHHLRAATFPQRASYLQMIARQNGMNELADRFNLLPFPLPFSVLWAVWQPTTTTHRVIAYNAGIVGSNLGTEVTVDVANFEGRDVVVTGYQDGTVRAWDVATGKSTGEPLRGHSGPITAVAVKEFEQRTIIASGGADGTIQIWDLAVGRPIGRPIRSRMYGGAPTQALGLETVARQCVIISGGSHGNVEVWDFATGEPVGKPMQAFGGIVHWVAVSKREGKPVILSLHNDRVLRIWDFASRQTIGEGISSGCWNQGRIRSVATSTLGGRSIFIAGGDDGYIRGWDITTLKPVIEPLQGHLGKISALTAGNLAGKPVVITGDDEGTIRLWDLAARQMLGESTRQHDGTITSLVMAKVDGLPMVVSGGSDGTLQILEGPLSAPTPQTQPGQMHWISVRSLALGAKEGCSVVVAGGHDGFIRMYDLATGHVAGEPLHAHLGAVGRVIVTDCCGSQVIVSAADEPTLDVRDWETHESIGERRYGMEADVISKLSAGCISKTGDGRLWMRDQKGGLFVSSAQESDKIASPGRRVSESYGLGRVVRAWRLSTGHAIGQPICGDRLGAEAIATAILNGRALILTGEMNGMITSWDLATGKPFGKPLDNEGYVNALAAVEFKSRPIVVSGDNEGTVRAWDVATGMLVAEPLRGSASLSLLDMVEMNGRVVIGCLRWKNLDFTDLITGLPVRASVLSPDRYVTSLAVDKVGGRLTVVTVESENMIRIWEVDSNAQEEIKVDATISSTTLVPDSRVVVGSSRGLMMLKWNKAPLECDASEK